MSALRGCFWAVSPFVVLVAIGVADAALIGINFVGKGTVSGTVYTQPLAATESAGAPGFTQFNWNNAAGSSNPTGGQSLYDENGQGTGATLTWTYADKSYTSISDTPGDRRMMRGYLSLFPDKDPVSVTVSGLGALFTVHGYSVVVYFDGENATKTSNQDWVTEYFLTPSGGTAKTVFGKDAGGTNFNGTYTPATGTTAAGATAGNYVRFDGLKASAFTLTATPATGAGPINAIQIIAAPEPTTLGLILLGGAVLIRRRRIHSGR